jgi:hypothetical protein
MDRKTVTEWVKWGLWVISLATVIITWQVQVKMYKLKEEARDAKIESQAIEIKVLKEELYKTKDYAKENHFSIDLIFRILELDAE